ncbi:MAG: peptidase M50, partial [Cellulomonadaceae bacterium]|nr:peptidase M50 [Cellulomonadaceae bacterium]
MARAQVGRTSGWVVGRAAGAPVVLSPGWVVAATVLTVVVAPVARRVAPGLDTVGVYVLALVAVLMLFASTFLHELGHALVARRHGIGVHQIALTLLGGHTELGGLAPTPRSSSLVALAGPVTNLALAGVAGALWKVLPSGGPLSWLMLAAALTNLFVGVFNLLPGLPLDGGRVLEALVWAVTTRRRTGTTVAAWAGRVIAIGVLGWTAASALTSGAYDLTQIVWGVLIGAFVWSGAGQSLTAARSEHAVATLSVRALMQPAVALPAVDRLGELDAMGFGGDAVLLGPLGEPVGYVDPAAAAAVPAPARATTPLTAVAVPLPA